MPRPGRAAQSSAAVFGKSILFSCFVLWTVLDQTGLPKSYKLPRAHFRMLVKSDIINAIINPVLVLGGTPNLNLSLN